MMPIVLVLVAFVLGAVVAWFASRAVSGDVSALQAKLRLEEEELANKERDARERRAEIDRQQDEIRRTLEGIAQMSQDEARERLVASIDAEVREKLRGRLRDEERRLEAESQNRAARVLADAMQRLARTYVSQGALRQVVLPTDDMKGRIIGREGRNARAFELATGTDIIIDESPGVVGVSSFNPLRRTVAAVAMERLVADGRIHPARIEEVVAEVHAEVDAGLGERGAEALREAGLDARALDSNLARLLGRLHYHDSGGQSMLAHAIETACIAQAIARELGLSAEAVVNAGRAGLLHDVGKAVTDPSASHADAGAKAAERAGEAAEVVRAIREHHASSPESLLGVIVHLANTLSKERPGARREAITRIDERVTGIEAAALGVSGVAKAFAVQAGAELRVFVDPAAVDDAGLDALAREVAAAASARAEAKSAIAVTVIRQTRALATARL